MRILLLTVLLTALTLTTSAEETTTGNLLSQDFSTGWSGTATQRHDNSTVAMPLSSGARPARGEVLTK